ncbi:MAG: hypothetical protein QOG19_2706 [Mycobacterium sp.]|nr:hypothetical protein [Mycobacterium sp.]
MAVSCPSYADTHALDWARAVSAESPHCFQMMHAPASGPALPADTASGRRRKSLQLGYSK